MLKLLRRHLNLVLWTLVACFVLWEIGSVLASRQAGSLYAGTLFGRSVTLQEYKAALDATQHRAQLTYGERSSKLLPRPELERQTWDRLMLLADARRAHIRVSDREIIEELQRWPLFQKEGRFDLKTYELVVHYSLGATPRTFEEEVRGQLAILKLLEQTTHGVTVSDEELLAAYRAEAAQVRVAYLVVEPSTFLPRVTVSEDEIRAAYRQRADEFQAGPKPMPLEEATPKIRETLQQTKTQQLARATAQQAYAAGQEQVAAKARDPLATAAKALGLSVVTTDWVKRDSPMGEAGTAGALLGPAFGLEVGQIGGPWHTSRGWVIAQLLERRPIDDVEFAKARNRLRDSLLERKRLMALNAWMRRLRDDAKPRPNPQFSASTTR